MVFNYVPFRCRVKNLRGELTKLRTGFNNVDCSNGTCDGCSGIFGFDFESAVVATAESGGTVNLTLVRLAGTDGEVSVTVDVVEGNATVSSDYGGTWPTQVCVCVHACARECVRCALYDKGWHFFLV